MIPRKLKSRLAKHGAWLMTALVVMAPVYWRTRVADDVLAQSTLGGPLSGLTAGQQSSFSAGQTLFLKTWAPADGLGPVFTATGCAVCHFNPTTGGMGNSTKLSTFFAKTNVDGSFNPLENEGGILLQRGTIQSFSSVSGACPVPGETVPTDATIIRNRMPPPLFGDGLIDAVPDSAILANAIDQGDGVHGTANMVTDFNGNVRPGRFGRKAQFASLAQTVAGAFQHDLGITNPVNPNKDLPQGNPIPSVCIKNPNRPNDKNGQETINLFDFAALLAPTPPATLSETAQAGLQTFVSIGCAKCHVASYTTAAKVQLPTNFTGGLSPMVASMSEQSISPYSDFLVHDMGPLLADGVPMGQASGSQWRTTPLWGLSRRTLYLHDGRTSNLITAITLHGGEASTVISNFKALSASDQADLLDFLNSL